jgi:hypothetical protein
MTRKATKAQQGLELTDEKVPSIGSVKCLGHSFENDAVRREFFTHALREKLKDRAFRQQDGFPQGTDEDILRMSDPPFYTACPNPFLDDFIRSYGRPYDASEPYLREPFAVDTSVGKTDAVYKAHGYHTKVPHLAIVPSILHYTKPGDVVLDGFAGSGMTGVAAQWCGAAPPDYRKHLELEWKRDGRPKPEWGARRVILNDLGPAATFISAGYNLPFDAKMFADDAARILDEVDRELAWMYETRHDDGQIGRINHTVWSEIFGCPECSAEIVFTDAAVDMGSGEVKKEFTCGSCRKVLKKSELTRIFETVIDRFTRKPHQRLKRVPVIVNYSIGTQTYEKKPDAQDFALIATAEQATSPVTIPTIEFPFDVMWEAPRLKQKGILAIHHLFFARTLHVVARLWAKSTSSRERRVLRFWIQSQLTNLSLQNRYRPQVTFPYNPLAGVYYICPVGEIGNRSVRGHG